MFSAPPTAGDSSDGLQLAERERASLEDTMRRMLEHLEKIDADLECLKAGIKSPDVIASNISIMKTLCESIYKLCK